MMVNAKQNTHKAHEKHSMALTNNVNDKTQTKTLQKWKKMISIHDI